MGWFSDSNWDPTNWGDLGDVPIVGDVWKGITGDPEAIKAAYDTQIAAARQQSAEMKDFLMGQKAQAQGIYGPIQSMFQQAYGTKGLQAPQIPQSPQAGPIQNMYGKR